MSNEGGCCGGGRKQSDSSRREAVSTRPGKDDKPDKTNSLPVNQTATVPTSTESPASKTHRGSCCG